jgi:hypothetical protein
MELSSTMILDFPVPQTVRNKFLLFISYSGDGILLQWPQCIKTGSFAGSGIILALKDPSGIKSFRIWEIGWQGRKSTRLNRSGYLLL